MATVFVAETSYNKAKKTFLSLSQETGYDFVPVVEDEQQLAEKISKHGVKAFIADIHPYTDALYTALPKGGVIARFGVGHDSIDKTLAAENELYVANTPGALDNAVAEHSCWMMGCMARKVHKAHSAMSNCQWQPETGFELKGRKVTIVGFGRIGKQLCKMLTFGFNMKVTGVGLTQIDNLDSVKNETGVTEYTTDLDSAIKNADFVVLLLPVNDSTTQIADAAFFHKMQPSAILVNSARGSLVNEDDLFDALSNKAIAGACLDVFAEEPYSTPNDKDLRILDNILLTPHIGSNTLESNAAMARTAAHNCITILEKGPSFCPNIINL